MRKGESREDVQSQTMCINRSTAGLSHYTVRLMPICVYVAIYDLPLYYTSKM